jgi:hypothetical protein
MRETRGASALSALVGWAAFGQRTFADDAGNALIVAGGGVAPFNSTAH